MRQSQTPWGLLAWATALAALLVISHFRQPAKTALWPSSAGAGSSAITNAGEASQDTEPPPSPRPMVPVANRTGLSPEARKVLVVARLRDWEEQDDADSRLERMQELEALLDGTNLFEIVQDLPPNLMDYAFALPLLHQRIMSDPKAAADWMESHTNISEAHVFTLIHDWGQKDREELRAYLDSLPEGEWKEKAMAAASGEVLSSDPVEAVVWAGQLSPGERQAGLLGMAALDWARRDPEAAAEWVGQVNDPAMREQLAGSLAIGCAETDPVQGAARALQLLPPGETLDRSLAEIAWTWAMREPEAATTWVAQFPEGPARQMALGNVMGIWGNRDGAAALAWIEHLPESPLQTEAAADLLATLPVAIAPEP